MCFITRILIIGILLRVNVVVAFREGDVRLANSNNYGEGRVEVFYEGSWGTICQNGWGLEDAEVICRQLGFQNGAQRAQIQSSRFGVGTGDVLLSNVGCSGDENNLLECNNVIGNWRQNECDHGRDVSVRCNAPNYQGCFPYGLTLGAVSVIPPSNNFETCYEFCQAYQYLWMFNGNGCACAHSFDLSLSLAVAGRCSISCPGHEDWICGGNNYASVYKVRVDLPFVSFGGFPGQIDEGSIQSLTTTFTPQGDGTGVIDYVFVRVHQLDVSDPSDFLMAAIPNIQRGSGNYWISTGSNPITISYTNMLIGGNGLLLEVGGGQFCAQPPLISNGQFSTLSMSPYTVGDQFDVTCDSGYLPYDPVVFCLADGTLNRPIICESESGVPLVTDNRIETQPAQPPVQTSSELPPVVITFGPNIPIRTATGQCVVPVVSNGRVNGTAIREVVLTGTVLTVTCSPLYTAVETTITCQRNGTFFPLPECERNQTIFIVVIVAAVAAFIFILILVIILVVCACYFANKKKRRIRDRERRERGEDIEFSSPYGGPPPLNDTNDDADTIFALPGDDDGTPPPEFEESNGGTDEPRYGTTPVQDAEGVTEDIGEEEASVLQGLNDVVQDMEVEGLYGQVVRPTIATTGFGGHFARS